MAPQLSKLAAVGWLMSCMALGLIIRSRRLARISAVANMTRVRQEQRHRDGNPRPRLAGGEAADIDDGGAALAPPANAPPLTRLSPSLSSASQLHRYSPQPRHPRATRRARARAALPDLFSLVPVSDDGGRPTGLIGNLTNPCWTGRYRANGGKGELLEGPPEVMCMPHFYLIGHVKAGSSDVWAVISKHPSINTGGVLKEQHYYSRPWITAAQYVDRYKRFSDAVTADAAPHRPTNANANTNAGCRECIAGDATPDLIWANLRYLNNPFGGAGRQDVTIAEVIAELHPESRLLLSLRNPVDRLWSDFFYFAHRPNHERDLPLPHPDTEVTAEHFDAFARRAVEVFEECMQDNTVQHCAFATRTHRKYHAGRVRFAMACYGPFVEEYLAHFDRSQLYVTSLDQWKASKRAVAAEIFEHLKVHPPSDPEWETILGRSKAVNQQGEHYKKLQMLTHTREMLLKAYRPCVEHLDNVLGTPRRFEKLWYSTAA